jgi:hypothetical protein
MKLITSTTETKLFKIIPRYIFINNVTVRLTSESTNITIEKLDITVARDENYMNVYVYLDSLVEGDFYRLEILNTSSGSPIPQNTIIYKDRVFCTDQDVNQKDNEYYSVNKDRYISEESSDNEFIII